MHRFPVSRPFVSKKQASLLLSQTNTTTTPHHSPSISTHAVHISFPTNIDQYRCRTDARRAVSEPSIPGHGKTSPGLQPASPVSLPCGSDAKSKYAKPCFDPLPVRVSCSASFELGPHNVSYDSTCCTLLRSGLATKRRRRKKQAMEGCEKSHVLKGSMLGLRLAVNLSPSTHNNYLAGVTLSSCGPRFEVDQRRSRREGGNSEVRSTPSRYVKQDYVLVTVRVQCACGCADTEMRVGNWTCVGFRERHR